MRGLLAECGVIAEQGTSAMCRLIATVLAEAEDRVSGLLREILSEMNGACGCLRSGLSTTTLQIAELAARTNERVG